MTHVLVNLDVDDLERAIAFYGEALGLRLGRRLEPDFVELVGANVPIYLLLKEARSQPFRAAPATRAYSRHWTPVHLDFVVEDVEAAAQQAERAGATREGPITDHAWGRMALMADPFGHGFCLLQFKGRGYDELV
jgi:predicted enzyme related to lactoylglutathione lyase